jgi:hypothetical protein
MQIKTIISTLLIFVVPAYGDVVYVNASADGANDGSSWADAYAELKSALAVSGNGDQVWVAAGTYYPDYDPATGVHTGDPNDAFHLLTGLQMYGGFAGDEENLSQRAGLFDETVLEGDLLDNDGDWVDPLDMLNDPARADNANNVVRVENLLQPVTIDGFRIQGGNAVSVKYECGGGVLLNIADATVRNCIVQDNTSTFGAGLNITSGHLHLSSTLIEHNAAFEKGGGASLNFSQSWVARTEFIDNASMLGGGLSVSGGSARIDNATFAGNGAACRSCRGGGIATMDDATLNIVNSVFTGNEAGTGAGLDVIAGDTHLANLTIAQNIAADAEGAGLRVTEVLASDFEMHNSIVWGNSQGIELDGAFQVIAPPGTVYHSNLQGLVLAPDFGGFENFDEPPRFERPRGTDGIPGTRDDNLRLRPDSSSLNRGDNEAIPPDVQDLDGDDNMDESVPLDHDDEARLFNGIVDLGAFELQLLPFNERNLPPGARATKT